MSKILNLSLTIALMLTSITAIDAAPVKKAQPKKTTGYSLKTKAIAAASFIAAGIIAIIIWKFKNRQAEDPMDNNPFNPLHGDWMIQNPGGRSGQLMQYLMAHNRNLIQITRNDYDARRNIEQLFNHPRFVELLNGPRGQMYREQLIGEFNRQGVLNNIAHEHFVTGMVAGLNQQEAGLNTI